MIKLMKSLRQYPLALVLLLMVFAIVFAMDAQDAVALDQIIRPYQSVRSSAMGGVRFTTGVYDENFFANPARVTENRQFKITLFDPMIESNPSSIGTTASLMGDGDVVQKIGETAGENAHGRVQFTMPAFYFPATEQRKVAVAVAVIQSIQYDVDLRRSFQLSPQAVVDMGPAVTLGKKYDDDKLSLGVTAHLIYRMASKPDYSLIDLIKGVSFSPTKSGGDGAMIDFDLGGTYVLPWKVLDFDLTAGGAINNVLGGNYSNIKVSLLKNGNHPPAQPRSLSFGVAARRSKWQIFTDSVFAFELTDIGNNDGGIFRYVHFGGEAHYGIWIPRLGFNQGYWTAGVGVSVGLLTVDFSSYGEEMSLNAGGMEDRRYAFRFALEI